MNEPLTSLSSSIRMGLHTIMTLMVSFLANGQGRLTGTITEANGQPVPGAHISVMATHWRTVSEFDGQYQFNNLPAGRIQVEVSFIGFESDRAEVEIASGQTITLNFSLVNGNVNLKDLVISSASEKPVNTLSSLDIQLRPSNSTQDVLRMVPGLFIAQHAGGGKAEQIFLRGFDVDHGTDINLEVDGLPVNMVSHAHGQGYSDLHFLIPEIISLVDFDKGPYYASKGDFATAGYVSFQTKNILDRNFIKQEVGRFGTRRTVAGVNLKKTGYIASEFFQTNGYFKSPQDLTRFNITGKYNLLVAKNNKITFGASYFNSGWNASGQIPKRAVQAGVISRYGSIDNTEGGKTDRLNIYATFNQTRSKGTNMEHQLYAVRYGFNLYSNFTFFLHNPVHGDQIQQRESRMIYGYKSTLNATGTFLGKEVTTEAGLGFRFDDVCEIALAHTMKRSFLSYGQLGNLREVNVNGYISETLLLSPDWSVETALRFDYFTFKYHDKLLKTSKTRGTAIISPKLNIGYQANANTQFFMKSGFGFHSNDARVVVAQNGSEILPRAFGFDVGVNSKLSPKLFLHLALWKLNLQQEFVYVGDEGIVEPSGKTNRQGIDLSLRYQLLSWLFADADVNLTKPRSKEDPKGQDYIPLAPVFTSIGGFTIKTNSTFTGSLRYRYISDRAANENKSVLAQGYLLSDLVLNYTRKHYELGLSVENLFNRKWNEAQFNTESRLANESEPVSEIHFTPGTPLFIKGRVVVFF